MDFRERENIRIKINNWIRSTKSEDGGFDAFIDFDKVMKESEEEKNLKSEYDSGDGIHPNSVGYKAMVDAIDDLSIFTKEPNFNIYDYLEKLEILDKIGVKFKLDFNLKEDEEIHFRVNGYSSDSYGFRIALVNNEGEKTTDYFYSGKIGKGEFEIDSKLTVNAISNYIVIRRPISTININNIELNCIEVETENGKKIISPGEDGILL